MPEILFPRLGFATAEGTILHWEKSVGEAVTAGEPLVEIASEKAINVVVAPQSGSLLAIYAPPGAIVPEGETLGWIGAPGEIPPTVQCRIMGWEEEIAPPPENLDKEQSKVLPDPQLPELPALSRSPQPPKKLEKKFKTFLKNQLRMVTGKRLAKSWREAPKVDLFAEIDFSRVVSHRQAEKDAGNRPIPFNLYIVEAVVKAFQEFPELNCLWYEGKRQPLEGIHVGVAVALEESLVTISMKNLAGLGLEELQQCYRKLIRKAVGMTLSHQELYGSSLTLTNLGEFEIFGFTPVLNPPEIFILAIGELKERPVVREGELTVAPVSYFCLSFDHRGVDGGPASKLLRTIKHQLEQYGEG